MLPYDEYKTLEKLVEYVKTSDDINKNVYEGKNIHTHFLEEAMIIVMRGRYIYFLQG